MPDTSPSIELLRRLGFNLPTTNVPENIPLQNKIALEQQKKNPLWKQYVGQGVDALTNIPKGLLGIDPDPNESSGGYIANVLSQLGGASEGLVKAGLPLEMMTKGKPVYHGTSKVFEKFNPSKYDTHDILGYMTHFAESPDYAESYASGLIKAHPGYEKSGSNIIAAKPMARNVLDLTNPNMDDLSQTIASLNPDSRNYLVRQYKESLKRKGKGYGEGYDEPIQNLANMIQSQLNRPGSLEQTPFDAVKYSDEGYHSYAVPRGTPIKSAYGAPLTDEPNPIRVIRNDTPGGGLLKVNETNRSMNKMIDPYERTEIANKPMTLKEYDAKTNMLGKQGKSKSDQSYKIGDHVEIYNSTAPGSGKFSIQIKDSGDLKDLQLYIKEGMKTRILASGVK